jgi:hypothetical protein
MFIAILALSASAGCAQRYVLRMSNPEQASTVTLFEGHDPSTEDDDQITTLDDPAKIAKVAAFFRKKSDEYYAATDPGTKMPVCTVTFRNELETTDRFYIEPTHIWMKTPKDDCFRCDITPSESHALVAIFRGDSKSSTHK